MKVPDVGPQPSMGAVIEARLSRRGLLAGALAVSLADLSGGKAHAMGRTPKPAFPTFTEIAHGADEMHHVAEGYDARILLRWGDPVTADAPAFDPLRQSAEAQLRQFGYNNDYTAFVPLPARSGEKQRGLLCVNHEYVSGPLMFPARPPLEQMDKAMVDTEMAAHGLSVVEIVHDGAGWSVDRTAVRNRRYTTLASPFEIGGPARGAARMRTADDPDGVNVIGTLANCGGGMTPWGSYLSGEENFDGYFQGRVPLSTLDARTGSRFAPDRDEGPSGAAWWRHHARFDLTSGRNNEAYRFGWVVEIDPLDPVNPAKKRTALGRMKHECAETILAPDGRLVVYLGDDERMQFLYRFVTRHKVHPTDRAKNRDLLDEGVLSVARFSEDGSLRWLPLVHGEGPLTAANGFATQADVLIDARKAAYMRGATPMDRPEDVQPNPVTGRVYVMLTNNVERAQAGPANPRPANAYGHILELTPPGGDQAAEIFQWDVLVRCGDPSAPEVGAQWHRAITVSGWFAAPDNCAIDPQGRLWVASDQGGSWSKTATADGFWALGTQGAERGLGRMFFRVPIGAEMAGPTFTPDGRSLFLSVQHPAADGITGGSSYEKPATRWPDFRPDLPPRPSVVAITRRDGGVIGS